jgi:hypothetical protein
MGERIDAERVLTGGNLRGEKDHLEDLDANGRLVLTCTFKKQDGNVDWIHLAQDRDERRAAVNTVMNFLIPHNANS